jgi:hypothetical protein
LRAFFFLAMELEVYHPGISETTHPRETRAVQLRCCL